MDNKIKLFMFLGETFDNDEDLEDEESNGKTPVIRYYMCGITDENNKFTGKVQDYVGGGSYQDFFFLNGENISADDETYVYDEDSESAIEKEYPGLISLIEHKIEEFGNYADDDYVYVIKEEKMDLFHNDIYDDGALNPIEVGNTYFTEN